MELIEGNPTSSGATAIGATAIGIIAGPVPYPAAPSYPLPAMTAESEVTWSALAHLSWIAGSLVGGLTVLGPLVAWLALRNRGPFVRHHTAEALNAHLSYLLYALVLTGATTLFALVTFGLGSGLLLAPVALVVVGVVLSVVAAASASSGAWYRYPLVIRFVS